MSTISWSKIQELSLDAEYMDIPCLTVFKESGQSIRDGITFHEM